MDVGEEDEGMTSLGIEMVGGFGVTNLCSDRLTFNSRVKALPVIS